MHLIRAQYPEEKAQHALFGDASIMLIQEHVPSGSLKAVMMWQSACILISSRRAALIP